MHNLTGTPVSFNLKDYEFVDHLIWYDAPLVVLFKRDGKHFIASWIDQNEAADRYALIPLEPNELAELKTGKIPFRPIFSRQVIVFNWHNSPDCHSALELDGSTLPEGCLPTNDAYLSF